MTAEWLYSAEIRWFFRLDPSPVPEQPPQPPAPVLAWFLESLKLPWPQQSRTDRYLLLPGCTSTGVKLREGRFEIKALCRTTEPVVLADGITGLVDRWVKWSYGSEAAGPWTAALNRETAGWLDVTKWRLLRSFDLAGTEVVEVTEGGIPTIANTVELTVVRAHNRYWWTLGLEATGVPEKLGKHFKRLSRYFFGQTNPPLVLNEDHSYAYPTWIDAIT